MPYGKMLSWLVFGILLSLAPLIFARTIFWIGQSGATYLDLIGGGELLIVSTTLSASALESFLHTERKTSGVTFLFPFSLLILCLMFSTFCYGATAAWIYQADPEIDGEISTLKNARIASISLCLLAVSIFASMFSVMVTNWVNEID